MAALRARDGTPIWALTIRWLALAAVFSLAAVVVTALLPQKAWLAIVLVALVSLGVLLIYGSRHAIPWKYLLPGVLLLLAFQIWPTVYTVATAFTNYADGHSITKAESIAAIQRDSVHEVPGTPRYKLSVAVDQGTDPLTGAPTYLLTDQSDHAFAGTAKGLEPLPAAQVTMDASGRIIAAKGYTLLNAKQVAARTDLDSFTVPTSGGAIKRVGLSQAFDGRATMVYDQATDTITDTTSGTVFHARNARWVADNGTSLPQGWKENVGWSNFHRVLTDSVLRDGFVSIFLWNVVFAAVSVISTFLMGMFMALLFNHPRMRLRGLSRSILILPYALPGFVTALVWMSMFNQDYGLINTTLHLHIDWLGNALAAKAAVLITNLWLGFPYMFLICTGSLQSIPTDLNEAAMIDGATGWQRIRTITLPLLLIAVGPLLIASFAFNFNNFSLIYLLTGGGPFTGNNTTVGSTDLLITYAYRLAFGGVGNDYGLASTISIFIFIIVAAMAAIGFGRTRAWEDVN